MPKLFRKVPNLARKVYAKKKSMVMVPRASLPKKEVKKFDGIASDASIDQGGVLVHLTSITQGDLITNRNGNRINLKSIQFRCALTNADSGATTGTNTNLRCIVFRDMQMGGVAPTAAVLLEDTTVGDRFINSPLNVKYPNRFKVIHDRTYSINSTGVSNPVATDGAPYIQKRHFRFVKKLSGWITWTGANGSDVSNGHIYVLFITDQDEDGAFNFTSRVSYYDD